MKRHTKLYFKSRPVLLSLTVLVGLTAGFLAVQVLDSPEQQVIRQAQECHDVCIDLRADGMHPNELAVKVNDYVQFNSADGQKHNIAEGAGADAHEGDNDPSHHDHTGEGYLSGEFGPDEAWRVQFKKAGTYQLHDHYHPSQTILVVVYEPKTN